MKILQIGKFWPVIGGVEKVMFDLTQGFSSKGIVCDMLCAAMDKESQVISLNKCGRVITTRTLLKSNSTMISPEMVLVLWRINSDYDIIHIHHPDPMAAFALVMSGYKGKVVLHWHSDILRQNLLLQFYEPLQRWLLRRADRVICTSPNYAKGSKALTEVANKLSCIPIGCAPVIPDDVGVASLRKKMEGRRVIFSLGRLVPYKGFDNLILAAKYLPDDYMVVIAGSGPCKEKLCKLIAVNNLGQKVRMLGRISDYERNAWMGAASLFCLPSVEKTEAYGIVLIEAMSTGLPVVATNIPGSGTSWVNAHGISGLNVSCGAPKDLADAIIRIIDNKNIAEEYGINARHRWENLFTIERFIDNVADIYRNLFRDDDIKTLNV